MKPILLSSAILMLFITLVVSPFAYAQSEADLQEFILDTGRAWYTELFDATITDADTSAWLPLYYDYTDRSPWAKRPSPSRYFTLMGKLTEVGDTTEVDIKFQVALDTTGTAYEHSDFTLSTVSNTTGFVVPLKPYGGRWIRFIATPADTTRLTAYLWQIH